VPSDFFNTFMSRGEHKLSNRFTIVTLLEMLALTPIARFAQEDESAWQPVTGAEHTIRFAVAPVVSAPWNKGK
jgi:hypothetical protein